MKRTFISATVVERLNSINDLVWLQEFSLHELDLVSLGHSKKAAALCTTDLFGKNPYAARINIRLDKMPAFRRRLTEALLVTVFSQSFELLNDYIKVTALLLKHHGNRPWQAVLVRKVPEERLEDSWNATGYPAIRPELWNTFKYFRLRRNHYAHIAQIIAPNFTGFLAAQGAQLNQFWRDSARMGPAAPLDFSSQAIFAPVIAEVSAMLRAHLLWMLHFDPLVVAQLDRTKLISEFAKGHWLVTGGAKFRKNDATIGKLARKIRTEFRRKTGGSASVVALEKLIWGFKE